MSRRVPTRTSRFPTTMARSPMRPMRCVGVGACRKTNSGTMCPSYMATREEQHSTRGRAHLLWELMQSDALPDKWQNEQVHEALDLCLSCKACKSECPVRVDMATYKAEFLAQHYADRVHPLPHYLFGFMDRWARMASFAPSSRTQRSHCRAWSRSQSTSPTLRRSATLPRFASRSFLSSRIAPAKNESGHKTVLLWPDTWNNYLQPQVLDAAARVLRSAGFRVVFPRRHICCGRPLYDFGFLDQARRYLDDVLQPPRAADRCRHAIHRARAKLRQRLPRRAAELLSRKTNARSGWRSKPICWRTFSQSTHPIGSRHRWPAGRSCCTATATTKPCST